MIGKSRSARNSGSCPAARIASRGSIPRFASAPRRGRPLRSWPRARSPACPGRRSPDVGGAYSAPRPLIRTVTCVSGCAGVATVRAGSVVRVRGARLGGVRYVAFLGGSGRADDVVASARRATSGSVEAQIPAKAAVRGPACHQRRRQPVGRHRARVRVATVNTPIRGIGPIVARVESRRVFYDGPRRATLTYAARSARPVAVTIELVRTADGASIARWGPLAAAPGVDADRRVGRHRPRPRSARRALRVPDRGDRPGHRGAGGRWRGHRRRVHVPAPPLPDPRRPRFRRRGRAVRRGP